MRQEIPRRIGIAILSQHRLFVEGLSSLVERRPELLLTRLGSAEVPARVVLLDAGTEGALGRCRDVARNVHLGVLVLLSSEIDEELALEALRSGARGILPRSAGFDDLTKAIRVVAEGDVYADRRIVARALSLLSTLPAPGGRCGPEPEDQLTTREREVVRHTVGGLSNKEIADRMAISPSTVKAHLTRVFRKLEVRDRTQLVVHYHRPTRALQA
jgi:DNA-binding NarL/FixJ family response regulator